MYNDIAFLCKETITQDEYGNQMVTISEREIFCKTQSIGMREFYTAATTDLSPSIKLVLADEYDYEGEKLIKYDGVLYNVIRTFVKKHGIEIILERKLGSKVNE